MFLEVKKLLLSFSFSFSFFSLVFFFLLFVSLFFFFLCFLTKKMWKYEESWRNVFLKWNHIRAARVFLVRCAVEKSTIVCALVAFWIPESCVVSCCAPSFQFQRSPMSSSANGPLARTAKRHREVNPMMAGMNPFHASMFGPAFALLVPTRAESCWLCFDGSMRCVATRDQKRHWFLMCLFCQLLADVWHRVASVVKKISLDRLQPEQIKQDEVKSCEFYLFLCVYYIISFYLCLSLFISCFFFLYLFSILLFLFSGEKMFLRF